MTVYCCYQARHHVLKSGQGKNKIKCRMHERGRAGNGGFLLLLRGVLPQENDNFIIETRLVYIMMQLNKIKDM